MRVTLDDGTLLFEKTVLLENIYEYHISMG